MNETRSESGRIEAGHSRPSREQTLLLRAALLEKDAAIEAWREWRSTVDLDRFDEGSRRMLPLLHRNLDSFGVKDPWMLKFKGVYRMTWYQNHLLFYHSLGVIRALQHAGIETMILKGARLTLTHYRDYGLRPMTDFDLLVPMSKIATAVRILEENGWASTSRLPLPLSDGFLASRNANQFKGDAAVELDLHWHTLFECCEPDADEDFWKGAARAEIEDTPVFVLSATDELLVTCVHGAAGNQLSSIRWVADAMMILKSSTVDWDRLVVQAYRHHLVLHMRETLSYLRDEMGAQLPEKTMQVLQEMPVSRADLYDYRLYSHTWSRWGIRDRAWYHLRRSSEWARNTGSHPIFAIPRYFQVIWGLDQLWQVPPQIILKALRRSWRKTIPSSAA